jgi:hypothetical protein
MPACRVVAAPWTDSRLFVFRRRAALLAVLTVLTERLGSAAGAGA